MVIPLLARTLAAFQTDQNLTDLGRFSTHQYGEPYQSVTASAGPLVINVATAPVSVIALNGTVTALSFTGWPGAGRVGTHTLVIVQGAANAISAWTSVLWPGGSAPTITATAGRIDVLTFLTVNNGTSVLGFVSGQDFQ